MAVPKDATVLIVVLEPLPGVRMVSPLPLGAEMEIVLPLLFRYKLLPPAFNKSNCGVVIVMFSTETRDTPLLMVVTVDRVVDMFNVPFKLSVVPPVDV